MDTFTRGPLPEGHTSCRARNFRKINYNDSLCDYHKFRLLVSMVGSQNTAPRSREFPTTLLQGHVSRRGESRPPPVLLHDLRSHRIGAGSPVLSSVRRGRSCTGHLKVSVKALVSRKRGRRAMCGAPHRRSRTAGWVVGLRT